MPDARRTRSLAYRGRKYASSHHRHAETIRHSLREWFYGLFRALPGVPGFVATVVSGSSPRNLIPASGDQDHAVSPSVSTALVTRSNTSIASRPTFPDDREAPLMRAGRANRSH